MLGGRRWRSSGASRETAGDGRRRCSGSSRAVPPTRAQSRRPASRHGAGAATSGQSRREVRARATFMHATAPCTVRCARPPPAAPEHGRTCRHRAGILRLRTQNGGRRPPPAASTGHRRRPRRTVHLLQLKDTGRRAPDGGARSSDGLTVKPDLSSRVRAGPGGVHRPATQRPPGTPPCPGPRRGRTNWPATATVVVSIGRASARPSDARRRRRRRATTTTVGSLPRSGRSPGLAGPRGVSGVMPLPHNASIPMMLSAGAGRAVAATTTATGGRAVHSPAVQG